MKLNNAQIASKCVEVSKCLVNTGVGLVNYDLATTRSLGDAARLAVSIKRVQDPIPREMLGAITAALKIDFRVGEAELLPLLEQLNWIRASRKGKSIESIRETLPPVEDILSTLGKVWHERSPTVIDEATVASINELSKRPFAKDSLISELGIKSSEFETTFDYGEQARYLGKFTSFEHGVETVWTPLYWAGKADQVLSFLQKQKSEQLATIGSLTEKFRKHPGIPKELIDPKLSSLVDGGIWHGFFPAVEVKNRVGAAHEYVFAATPQFEVDPGKDIFEKARMIVACIRHGQYHAEVTKILHPRSILRAMRANQMKPHPYAHIQYAILVLNGLIRLESALTKYGKAWRVIWIDTPENNLAADIADQLLLGEEIYAATREDLEAGKILVQGMYSYTSEQRRIKGTQKIVAKGEFDRMMEMMGGVRR
jgi:hypothetical protein